VNAALPVLLTLQIVFCGDSLTKGWEMYNLFDQQQKIYVNGVTSCTSADILKRIEPIAARKPHKLFLMIGINEIKAQNRIIDNYDKIIKKIQEISPYTIIYVQSILPTRTKTIDNADIPNVCILTIYYLSSGEHAVAVLDARPSPSVLVGVSVVSLVGSSVAVLLSLSLATMVFGPITFGRWWNTVVCVLLRN